MGKRVDTKTQKRLGKNFTFNFINSLIMHRWSWILWC